jgi:hypothetical protein
VPTPRRVIAIPDNHWSALLAIAELNHTSASDLVREAIARFLADLGVGTTYVVPTDLESVE